jgi:hypothetical protein
MTNRTGAGGNGWRWLWTALAGALVGLSACSGQQIGDPWAGRDPAWKRAHFVSQTPDEALRERAALTQIDR